MSGDDTWVQTMSGVAFDLLDPKPEQVRLHDIAWSLARLPRFNGHTVDETPLSVAQHSMLVETCLPDVAEPPERLAALLHDAHEAYVSNVPSPMLRATRKYDVMVPRLRGTDWVSQADAFGGITAGIDAAVHVAFALPRDLPTGWIEEIKAADMLALRLERDAWMCTPPREWPPLPEPPIVTSRETPDVLASCWPTRDAYRRFVARVDALTRMRHGL